MIWGGWKREYFCKRDWTGGITLIRFNKFRHARKRRSRVAGMEPTGRREAPPDDRLRAIRGRSLVYSRIALRSIRATYDYDARAGVPLPKGSLQYFSVGAQSEICGRGRRRCWNRCWPAVSRENARQRTGSFRDGPKDQTSDVRQHIGESLDSGFTRSLSSGAHSRDPLACPGMTHVHSVLCDGLV